MATPYLVAKLHYSGILWLMSEQSAGEFDIFVICDDSATIFPHLQYNLKPQETLVIAP